MRLAVLQVNLLTMTAQKLHAPILNRQLLMVLLLTYRRREALAAQHRRLLALLLPQSVPRNPLRRHLAPARKQSGFLLQVF